MRIEVVGIGVFQAVFRAGASGGQRPVTLGTRKQQDMRKRFCDWLQGPSFRGLGARYRLTEARSKYKTVDCWAGSADFPSETAAP